jgi:hypothetical protein
MGIRTDRQAVEVSLHSILFVHIGISENNVLGENGPAAGLRRTYRVDAAVGAVLELALAVCACLDAEDAGEEEEAEGEYAHLGWFCLGLGRGLFAEGSA